MERIVNPTSDFFVRYLLGSEENKDILLDFINTILTDSGFKPAVKLELKNPFNLKTFINSKESILDVKAEDENKRIFDVEIQVIGNSTYIKRSLYYWAKNYQSQLKGSERYNELNPVICVNILDFILFNDFRKAHSCFLPTELDEKDYVLTDDFQIHFFELPKMDLDKETLDSRLEKWAFFFNNEGLSTEEEKMKILIKNDPVIKHAHNSYEKFTADDEMLQVYEAREKRLHDEATRLSDAKEEGLQKGRLEGLHQGMEKGMEKGIVKGIATGIAKGRLEGLYDSARKMKELGVSSDIICKSTGLSEEEIVKL